jgi:endonuclease/exonuclease/phosphatase family metal-dependent hydrolase
VRPVFGFDRIIASSEITIEAAGVHRSARSRVASDHLPVWANLELNGNAVAVGADAGS